MTVSAQLEAAWYGRIVPACSCTPAEARQDAGKVSCHNCGREYVEPQPTPSGDGGRKA